MNSTVPANSAKGKGLLATCDVHVYRERLLNSKETGKQLSFVCGLPCTPEGERVQAAVGPGNDMVLFHLVSK